MSLDWHAALQAVLHHPLFGVGITLAVYQGALAAYERTRWMFLQPVLVSMAVLIGILLLAGLSYQEYRESTFLLSVLLGPTTVALAVPLFLNLKRIRQLFWPTLITLLVAGLLATVLGVALAWAFGAERMMLMTLAPKSVTSPIAIALAEQMGGIPALTAVFVMITGVLGAVLGPLLLDRAGVTSPAARGLSLGLSAHAIGTAQALQEHPEAGGFAALAMSLAGAFSALALPLLLG